MRSIASRNDRAEMAMIFTGSYRSTRSSVPSFRPKPGSLLASAIPRCRAKNSSVPTRILSSNPTALVRQVADILLAKDLKAPEPAPAKETAKSSGALLSAEQMAALAGIYWNREDDDFHKIVVKDGKLQINVGGDEFHTLKLAGETSFHEIGRASCRDRAYITDI